MMRRNLLRFALTCGVGGLLFSMSTAEGATFALRAVSIKRGTCTGGTTPGAPCAANTNCGGAATCTIQTLDVRQAAGSGPNQELDPNPQQITAMPFDEITAEIRIFNFPEMNGTLGADIYQAVLENRMGATSGGNPAGLILPRGWDAPVTDTPLLCSSDLECSIRPNLHCQGGLCQGLSHSPLGNNFFIDVSRPDFLHAGRPFVQQFVSAQSLSAYTVVSILDEGVTPGPSNNPTNDYYGGTIVYSVGQFACGQFTFGFTASPPGLQVLQDSQFVPKVPQITPIPLIINMATCPPIIEEEMPDNCSIDARRPWTETEPATNPIPAAARQGIRAVEMCYDRDPATVVAGSFTTRRVPIAAAPDPDVSSVTQLDGDCLRADLNGAIPIRAFTCIKQDGNTPAGIKTGIERCWGFLPGDVSENGVTNALDIEDGTEPGAFDLPDDLVEWIDEWAILANRTAENLLRCDLDRTGTCNGFDVLTGINMLNGSGSIGPGGAPNGTDTVYNGTNAWLNQTFINNVVCPSPD